MKALALSSLPVVLLSFVFTTSARATPEDPLTAAYSILLKIVQQEHETLDAHPPTPSSEWELFGETPKPQSDSPDEDAALAQEMMDSIDPRKQKEFELETQTRFVAFLENVRFETTQRDLRTLGDSSALLDGENKRIQEPVAAYPDFSRRGRVTGLHDTILIQSERFLALTPPERFGALEAVLFGAFLGDEILIDKVFHTRARLSKILESAPHP